MACGADTPTVHLLETRANACLGRPEQNIQATWPSTSHQRDARYPWDYILAPSLILFGLQFSHLLCRLVIITLKNIMKIRWPDIHETISHDASYWAGGIQQCFLSLINLSLSAIQSKDCSNKALAFSNEHSPEEIQKQLWPLLASACSLTEHFCYF